MAKKPIIWEPNWFWDVAINGYDLSLRWTRKRPMLCFLLKKLCAPGWGSETCAKKRHQEL